MRGVRQITAVDELVGTKGATPADQANIDGTIAGACRVGALTPEECKLHGRKVRGD